MILTVQILIFICRIGNSVFFFAAAFIKVAVFGAELGNIGYLCSYPVIFCIFLYSPRQPQQRNRKHGESAYKTGSLFQFIGHIINSFKGSYQNMFIPLNISIISRLKRSFISRRRLGASS